MTKKPVRHLIGFFVIDENSDLRIAAADISCINYDAIKKFPVPTTSLAHKLLYLL